MERRPVPSFIQKRRYGEGDQQVVKVETKTLASLWRSKEDIYKFLTEQKQFYLPTPRGCNMSKTPLYNSTNSYI